MSTERTSSMFAGRRLPGGTVGTGRRTSGVRDEVKESRRRSGDVECTDIRRVPEKCSDIQREIQNSPETSCRRGYSSRTRFPETLPFQKPVKGPLFRVPVSETRTRKRDKRQERDSPWKLEENWDDHHICYVIRVEYKPPPPPSLPGVPFTLLGVSFVRPGHTALGSSTFTLRHDSQEPNLRWVWTSFLSTSLALTLFARHLHCFDSRSEPRRWLAVALERASKLR